MAFAASTAMADVNIGVSLPLTGPGSGLGIPMKNYFDLFPKEIAGETKDFRVPVVCDLK